ncbi:hypothetical protein GW17_00038669, partial [Ensete ventricosum]
MFKHYASVHFFWSLYFLEENVERDAVHKALMSLLRQDVKGNPKLSVSDLYKSWAELVQVFPIKAELLKPQVEMERHVTNLVKKVILILFCRLYMIFLWQLPEERKLDLLKNVAVSSPYATAQDSRQLLPSIVTLLKILYSNFDVPQKYMPRRKTEGPKYDYLECLFFSFHHLAHKKTIKILLRGRLNSTEEVVRSAMKKLTQGVADHNKALSAAKTEEEKANTKTEQQRATMALRNCNNILAMTQVSEVLFFVEGKRKAAVVVNGSRNTGTTADKKARGEGVIQSQLVSRALEGLSQGGGGRRAGRGRGR